MRSQFPRFFPSIVFFLLVIITGCETSKLSKASQRKTNGRTFVITGASSGFGRGVAVQLGHYGANVVIAARRTDVLEEVAREIISAGGKALVVTTDVSSATDMQKLADAAIQTFGKIDVWINNAGVASVGPFWDVPVEDHARVVDVNLKGVIYGSHIAIKIFMKQGSGVLINTGSVESEVPVAYHSSYAATKAGIRTLTNTLYQELRYAGFKKKIRVVTVLPWAADTPFFVNGGNHSGGTLRAAAFDDPQKVVNTIIYASLYRNRELPAGGKARTAYRLHHVFPHFTERLAAAMGYYYQIKTAPPAPHTSGNLFETRSTGTGVEGGVRERMKKEKKERRRQKKNQR
jgi:short-subunit dehydrogenase